MGKLAHLPLSRENAAEIIKQLVADSCNVVIVDECSKGAWQQTVASRQIYRCLEAGVVLNDPKFSEETGCWECRMGRFAAGQDIVVTVMISRDRSELYVINVCVDGDGD